MLCTGSILYLVVWGRWLPFWSEGEGAVFIITPETSFLTSSSPMYAYICDTFRRYFLSKQKKNAPCLRVCDLVSTSDFHEIRYRNSLQKLVVQVSVS